MSSLLQKLEKAKKDKDRKLELRTRLKIIRERERLAENQQVENKNEDKLASQELDVFGFPKTTTDGHPLQSLEELDQKTLQNQTKITLLLFYAYVEPSWKQNQYKQALDFSQRTAEEHQITGRLRVATEGFNGTMTGESNNVRRFCLSIKKYNPQLFGRVDFKMTDNLPPGQAFPQLKVFPVQEIVNYGLGDKQPPLSKGGIHLNAQEYHEKMKEKNTVIVDVRNTYEACIGKFQPPPGGAEYIDPKMRVSTEFPKWVDDNKENLKGKQIMMFCTGGIRCERASALLRDKGYENEIYQMQGGIHSYLENHSKDGGFWVGKNYTFDKRFGHGAEISTVVGKCLSCEAPWDKYRGNKRCPSCRVPLLICDPCQKEGKDTSTVCTLCKEEGKTPVLSNRQKRKIETSGQGAKNQCAVCEEEFRSRNGLFKHLEESGHQDRRGKRQRV